MKKRHYIFLLLITACALIFLAKNGEKKKEEKLPVSQEKMRVNKTRVKKIKIKKKLNTNSCAKIVDTNALAKTNFIPAKIESFPKKDLSYIPDEPCPADNFDIYIDEALQVFRKNLSDEEKDKALQNADAIGTPDIMPVIMLALDDDNSEIRNTAIDAIQSLDDPCVIPAVEKALDDSDPINRMDAVNALLRVDDERINDSLIKAITDPNEDVRETAFEVMLFQESPTVLPAAEAAAQIKNPEIQKQAISVLEDIPSANAIDSIIDYGLLSDYDDVRDAARKSLQKLTGKNINSYNEWTQWWEKNKNTCPKNLSADEWAEWWNKQK